MLPARAEKHYVRDPDVNSAGGDADDDDVDNIAALIKQEKEHGQEEEEEEEDRGQEDDEEEEELDVSEAKAAEVWENVNTALAKQAAEIVAARITHEKIAAILASMAQSNGSCE